ncbi:hypothetical protein [Kribbella sp. ALI-6-A]|uniref:hypothetical protein n=1 Tax=Kribbella sp. ALI-6-A TaxID=1933817 RepID=UPI00143D8EDC|nr:hypothetical protein [Kribbella sp. ALI-6-A]
MPAANCSTTPCGASWLPGRPAPLPSPSPQSLLDILVDRLAGVLWAPVPIRGRPTELGCARVERFDRPLRLGGLTFFAPVHRRRALAGDRPGGDGNLPVAIPRVLQLMQDLGDEPDGGRVIAARASALLRDLEGSPRRLNVDTARRRGVVHAVRAAGRVELVLSPAVAGLLRSRAGCRASKLALSRCRRPGDEPDEGTCRGVRTPYGLPSEATRSSPPLSPDG